MSKSLVIVASVGFLVLAACSGKPPTRCDQWGWYKPCDLVEGRYAGSGPCSSPCQSPCRPGQVVKREWAFPAEPCNAPPMQTVEMPQSATGVVAPATEPMPAPEPAPEPVPEPAPVPPTG